MEKTVTKYLTMCWLLYQGSGKKDNAEIATHIAMWTSILESEGLSPDIVQEAFKKHIKSSKFYPTPADIITMCKPVQMYQMDSGPLGFAGLYPADHWYVRQVAKYQGDISRYLVTVEPEIAETAKIKANAAVRQEVEEDETPEIEERRGGGFRRIEWSH